VGVVATAIGLAAAPAHADPPPFAPPGASPAPPEDVVVLGDDTVVRGRVLEVRRGERVVVRDAAGRDYVLPWSNVKRVDLAPGSAAAPPPPPSGPVAGSGAEALGRDSERARLANRLVVGGVVAWTFGYVMSAIGAAAGMGIGASQKDGHGASCFKGAPYAFIPVAGAAVAAAEYPRHTIIGSNGFVGCAEAAAGITAFGVVDTIVQVGGLGVLVGGLVYDAGTPEAPRVGAVRVVPGAPSAPAGLSAVVSW
jgi:hypothetical protein